jgi:SAM-dependent methyltransferase
VNVDGATPPHNDALAGLGDAALQSLTLESLTSARVYHRWLTDLALPYLGEQPIELGSGLGDYAEVWLAAGVPRLTLTDLDPVRLELLRRRFADRPEVLIERVDLFDPPQRDHSCLVAYNVLEHIDDDAQALKAAHRLLAPGGAVVMFVPAFPFAMGEFDRKVGHFRRYTKRTLLGAYESAGLQVERLHYVNAPGLLAWFLGVRVLRMTPIDSPFVRLWDRVITRAERVLERRLPPPFGQSVFAVGRVPA